MRYQRDAAEGLCREMAARSRPISPGAALEWVEVSANRIADALDVLPEHAIRLYLNHDEGAKRMADAIERAATDT